MTTIFLVILFLLQIIGFYFLALLYTKVSKFDDLEKKQRKLMEEMDDSIGAYLAELKDENERLIAKLSERDAKETEQKQDDTPIQTVQESVGAAQETKSERLIDLPKMPVKLALKSYNNTVSVQEPPLFEQSEPELEDDRTRAIALYDAGHSIETIAKKLGKGKTEVELILKFK